jgi:hypothetical protein
MLDWLYPLFYALAALGIGALCLPIALSLQFQRDGLPVAWQLLVQLAFFRGGLGLGLRLDPQRRSLVPVLLGKALPFPSLALRAQAKQKKKTVAPKTETKDPSTERDLFGLLRLLLKPGLGLLASLPRTIGLKSLRIKGRLGFADPAQTGSVNGYLQAVKSVKNKLIKINISPDFTRPGAFGQLDLVAHFHLGLLLLLLGRFGLQVGCRFLAARLFGWKPGLI